MDARPHQCFTRMPLPDVPADLSSAARDFISHPNQPPASSPSPRRRDSLVAAQMTRWISTGVAGLPGTAVVVVTAAGAGNRRTRSYGGWHSLAGAYSRRGISAMLPARARAQPTGNGIGHVRATSLLEQQWQTDYRGSGSINYSESQSTLTPSSAAHQFYIFTPEQSDLFANGFNAGTWGKH